MGRVVGSVWKGMRGSSRVLIMFLTLSAGYPDVFILWKFTELYSYCWCISLYVIKIKKTYKNKVPRVQAQGLSANSSTAILILSDSCGLK